MATLPPEPAQPTAPSPCPRLRHPPRPPSPPPPGSARWPSRSAPTPGATTGPGPATPRRWWTASSPRAPGATSSTPAAAPASRPGCSGRPAAGCSASTPTRGWRGWPARAGWRWRWRSSSSGTRPGGRSTPSSPARPGTGSTWRPGPPRPRRCCAPADGWRCSGTRSIRRPSSARPSARSTSGWCPTRRWRRASGPGPRPSSTSACATPPPTGCGRRGRSTTRRRGGSTGPAPTRGRSGWTRCRPSAATACSRPPCRPSCWPGSAPPSTRSAGRSRWITPPWWPRRPRDGRPWLSPSVTGGTMSPRRNDVTFPV